MGGPCGVGEEHRRGGLNWNFPRGEKFAIALGALGQNGEHPAPLSGAASWWGRSAPFGCCETGTFGNRPPGRFFLAVGEFVDFVDVVSQGFSQP